MAVAVEAPILTPNRPLILHIITRRLVTLSRNILIYSFYLTTLFINTNDCPRSIISCCLFPFACPASFLTYKLAIIMDQDHGNEYTICPILFLLWLAHNQRRNDFFYGETLFHHCLQFKDLFLLPT